MKIAIAGKGGVGKTTVTAWLGDYLARSGKDVWMVDADTALSLGEACGLRRDKMPEALIQHKELLQERIRPDNSGFMDLNPRVGDLPESLSVTLPLMGEPFSGARAGQKRLLVMGAVANAGGGCACDSNALLKALLAHLVLERREWVLVDMEAGVEHLGRGTVAHVDQLLVVSEPSLRALETAAEVGRMARDLGLARQLLVLNQATEEQADVVPGLDGLPQRHIVMPSLPSLKSHQLASTSAFPTDEAARRAMDAFVGKLCVMLATDEIGKGSGC